MLRFVSIEYPSHHTSDVGSIIEGFAEAFAGRVRGRGDIADPSHLDGARLDYSDESLSAVDAYLTTVHASRGRRSGIRALFSQRTLLVTPEVENTILWGGAYVAEVIRRSRDDCEWVDYDDYVLGRPELQAALEPRS